MKKQDLYLDAYLRLIKKYKSDVKDDKECDELAVVKKAVIYAVKHIVYGFKEKAMEHKTEESIKSYFEFLDSTVNLMSTLTAKEFVRLFPIEKEYKGHKYSIKDYFYTRNYLKTLDMDKPIGENILRFLWEYHNWDLIEFNVEYMGAISDMKRLQGKPSLMEEFAEENDIKMHTLIDNGKEGMVLIDNDTGKSIRVRKKKPRYLRVVRDRNVDKRK